MNTLAVGTKTKRETALGSFELRWTTIWGVWVPPGFQPGLLLHLTELGYTVKARGHTIMTETDPDDPGHVDKVREAIRTYAEGSWNVKG